MTAWSESTQVREPSLVPMAVTFVHDDVSTLS
jgi:hypothetical protein